MTLTNRVSLFFLGWLGVAVLGFSIAMFAILRSDLHRNLDERLKAKLDQLAAAAEIDEEGVEWEPAQHRLDRGDSASDPIHWRIVADSGLPILSASAQRAP